MTHPTTTTDISDSLERLNSLDERIEQASWIPQEELLAMLLAGTMVIDAIINNTEMSQFTEQEVEFIQNLHDRIGETMNDLLSNDKDAM